VISCTNKDPPLLKHLETQLLQSPPDRSDRLTKLIFGAACVTLALHFLGIGLYPLLGTTEGRYAEMARKMYFSGQYLMPMFTDTEPFWGNPPVSIWLQVASMHIFGVTEFAARLPAWLCSFATITLTHHIAKHHFGARVAALSLLVLSSSYLGYVAFGKVHTDAALTFSVTLALVGFYQWLSEQQPYWYLAGIFGLGLGLLAKGPVTFIYVGVPVVLWLMITRQLWRLLTWLALGSTAAAAILLVAPWYIAAENAHPGYLEYFLRGELFQRLLDAGWMGELYDTGRAEPRGTILLYAVESLLPWSLLVPLLILTRYMGGYWQSGFRLRLAETNPLILYLLCWAIGPLLFFSFSANVVPRYLMPTLTAWSVILSLLLAQLLSQRRKKVAPVLFVIALAIPTVKVVQNSSSDYWYDEPRNQKGLVDTLTKLRSAEDRDVVYLGKRLYAAEFYGIDYTFTQDLAKLSWARPIYLVTGSGEPYYALGTHCQIAGEVNGYTIHFCEPAPTKPVRR
jgi:4-amino-4-deoxy-L-arabinose transferase-like glycosyltransferase